MDADRPTAHTLTVEFRRLLSEADWRVVMDAARQIPYAKQFRVDLVPAGVVQLSPWLHHHPTCARNTAAAACDCGLQATLAEVDPR